MQRKASKAANKDAIANKAANKDAIANKDANKDATKDAIATKDATAAKMRAIRQKNSGRVLQLSRVAMKAIQEIKQIEAAMAAEAAAEAQCPAAGRSFEAIYSDFVDDACVDVIDALEKDAANE